MTPHERLKLARENAGFKTALAASKRLNLAQSTYAGHESGRIPFTRSAAEYARVFGVTAEYLLGISGQGFPLVDANDFSAFAAIVRGNPPSSEHGFVGFGPRVFAMLNNTEMLNGNLLLFDPDQEFTKECIALAYDYRGPCIGYYSFVSTGKFLINPIDLKTPQIVFEQPRPLARLVATLLTHF